MELKSLGRFPLGKSPSGKGIGINMILIIGGAAQGKTAYANAAFGKEYKIIDGFHLRVREQLKEGKEPLEEAKALLAEEDNCVIISNEVGYGLVPVDAFEREYREMAGRVNCYLAGQAKQVIRVICGLGVRIK